MTVGFRLGGPNQTAIRLLEGWPNGLFYRPDVECRDHTAELIEQHFANGSSVFHDGDLYERYYFMRVQNYGHIGALEQAGIDQARVVATLPSPCEIHDGRIVDVAYAAGRVRWFRTLTPRQYFYGVFDKDYGFPPFRVGCYCRLEGVIPGVEY